MGSILQPGYVYWDGLKYVLQPGTGGIGPQGPAGPAGAAGAPGASGNAVLVFQPGGTTGGNVYETWAGLWSARTADTQTTDTPMTIVIDDSQVLAVSQTTTTIPGTGGVTINVISTNGFQSAGTFAWIDGATVYTATYTGTTSTSFIGCVTTNEGSSPITSGDQILGPAQIETTGITYNLNKNTAIVGFKNSIHTYDLYFGNGNNALPNATLAEQLPAQLPHFSIPDTVILANPSYLQNLIIYGVDSAEVGVFQNVGFTTMDVTLVDVQLAQVQGFIFSMTAGSLDCYGNTLMNGETNGYPLRLTGDSGSFIFNLNDNFSTLDGWITTGSLTGTTIATINTNSQNAQWSDSPGTTTVIYNGGSIATNWDSATAGQVLTMVDNGLSSNVPRATWQAGGGGSSGIGLQQGGDAIGGGPFTTLNFQSGASVSNEGGGVGEITISGGGGGITQLTADVTAGPGSGSQAATVVAAHNHPIANIASSNVGSLLGATTSTNYGFLQLQAPNNSIVSEPASGIIGLTLRDNSYGRRRATHAGNRPTQVPIYQHILHAIPNSASLIAGNLIDPVDAVYFIIYPNTFSRPTPLYPPGNYLAVLDGSSLNATAPIFIINADTGTQVAQYPNNTSWTGSGYLHIEYSNNETSNPTLYVTDTNGHFGTVDIGSGHSTGLGAGYATPTSRFYFSGQNEFFVDGCGGLYATVSTLPTNLFDNAGTQVGNNGGVSLPQSTITVVNTANMPSAGTFQITTLTATYTLNYNGKTATSLLNVTGGGSGELFPSLPVVCNNVIDFLNPTATITSGSNGLTLAQTTIASLSNGQTLPQSLIYVASTSGFPTSGTLYLNTANGQSFPITYTGGGGGGTVFTGCSGGTGTLSTGQIINTFGVINISSTIGFPNLIAGSGTLYVQTSTGEWPINYTGYSGGSQIEGCTVSATFNGSLGSTLATGGGVWIPNSLAYRSITGDERYLYIPEPLSHRIAKVDTFSNYSATTVIASGSNAVTLPQSIINVSSTSAFPGSGTIQVGTSLGYTQTITYTGTTGSSFTGCTGGTGTLYTGYGVAGSSVITYMNNFGGFSQDNISPMSIAHDGRFLWVGNAATNTSGGTFQIDPTTGVTLAVTNSSSPSYQGDVVWGGIDIYTCAAGQGGGGFVSGSNMYRLEVDGLGNAGTPWSVNLGNGSVQRLIPRQRGDGVWLYGIGDVISSELTCANSQCGTSLPQSTIYVSSVQGFPSSGTLTVTTYDPISGFLLPQTVTYTGINTSGFPSFTGCSGGVGMINSGSYAYMNDANIYIIEQTPWETVASQMQTGSVSLTSGVGVVNNGITIRSTSATRIYLQLVTPSGTLGANYKVGSLVVGTASNTGVSTTWPPGSFTVTSVASNGSTNTNDTSTLNYLIIG